MNLSENIRKLRIAKGISQVEFSKHIGVTKQCVSNWENDNILPSIEMLIKIAAYFSISTDSLLGLSPTKTLSVDGLSDQQIAHIHALIQDLLAIQK